VEFKGYISDAEDPAAASKEDNVAFAYAIPPFLVVAINTWSNAQTGIMPSV
jgi:hypothetical protein